MITIAFMTAIAALVGVSTATIESSLAKASKKQFITQSNVFYKDIKIILKDNVQDMNSSDDLDFLFSYPLQAADKEKGVSLEAIFSSDASKVNINKIIDANNTIAEHFGESMEYALDYYGVADKVFFMDIILDAIDSDLDERIYGSEIAKNDIFFKDGKIENMEHLRKIIDYYKKARQDPAIEKIPWEKIFSFKNEKIDFNYATKEALWFMLKNRALENIDSIRPKQITPYSSFDELRIDPNEKERLEKFKVEFFSPEIKCEVFISSGSANGTLLFSYNLNTKEASNLELSY